MQVVIRALNVLRLIGSCSRGLTLAEISDRLNLPSASAHRLVAVLEGEGFIARSPTNRRYFLGPAARDLVQSDYSQESPLVSAHAAVAEASKRSGETVFLSQFSGRRVVCLGISESRYPLRLFVRVGQTMPLHAAAAARTLLAWRTADEVWHLLSDAPLVAYTPDTPHDVDSVLEHLQLIRSRGYDVCSSELDENVWAVAAPVRASTGEVIASVTLAAPDQRMAEAATRQAALDTVLTAARVMSGDLGWIEKSGASRTAQAAGPR